MTYTYDPALINARGKDQMRFELGDTQTHGGAETCALSDEEYDGLLEGVKPGKKAWMYAKLNALEAIASKMAYQVDTKIDVLQYNFSARAELWQKMYSALRKQIAASAGVPTMSDGTAAEPPYFYGGMNDNMRAAPTNGENYSFRRMTK